MQRTNSKIPVIPVVIPDLYNALQSVYTFNKFIHYRNRHQH